LKKTCKFEHSIDLGVLLACKTPLHDPCIQIEKEENYADPDKAKKMIVKIYKAEEYEE